MASGDGDIRRLAFKYRSYTPLPFLLVMLVFAEPSISSILFGLAIVITGELIRFWGVSIAGSETRTTGTVGGTYLITNGPFAYVRNPLYLGNMLLYAGIGVMSMALFPWLLLVALTWFYLQYFLIVSREEEYLAMQFGAAYEHYRKHVARFLPRLTEYTPPDPPPKTASTREGITSERRTFQAIAIVTLLVVAKYIYLQWRG